MFGHDICTIEVKRIFLAAKCQLCSNKRRCKLKFKKSHYFLWPIKKQELHGAPKHTKGKTSLKGAGLFACAESPVN